MVVFLSSLHVPLMQTSVQAVKQTRQCFSEEVLTVHNVHAGFAFPLSLVCVQTENKQYYKEEGEYS